MSGPFLRDEVQPSQPGILPLFMRYRTGDRFLNAECRQAEIKGSRLHDLRHAAASKMIEAGADLVTVTKILAMRLSK